METAKKAKIAFILLVLIGVLSAMDVLVKGVNVDDIPNILLPYWNYIVIFFSSTPWIVLIGLGRNVYGYLRVYYRNHRQVAYDPDKLYETITLYTGGIVTLVAITSKLPAPYGPIISTIGSAVIVVIDILLSEIGHLRENSVA